MWFLEEEKSLPLSSTTVFTEAAIERVYFKGINIITYSFQFGVIGGVPLWSHGEALSN